MRLPKIVVFTGPMGSGKSEALKVLKTHLKNSNIQNVKFAQPLYDIQSYIYERVGKEIKGSKDRTLLQFLGTEWGRKTVDENLWVDIWERDVKHLCFFDQSNSDLIITSDDCRFDNEAKVVKNLGGIIVKISSDRSANRIDIQGNQHESEKGISNQYVDYIVENNGSIEELQQKLKYIFYMENIC